MRGLGRLGLALSAASLAALAVAANDSRESGPFGPAVVPVRLDLPVQPIAAKAPLTRGGWAREGWSDAPAAPGGSAASAAVLTASPPPAAPAAPAAVVGMTPAASVPAATADGAGWRALPEPEPPGGWRRQTWDGGRGEAYRYRRGGRLPDAFAESRFAVPDWQQYGLAPPGPGRTWVRYYDDAVLVDAYGTIHDAVPAIGWNAAANAPAFAYDTGVYGYAGRDLRWHDDGVTSDGVTGDSRGSRQVFRNPDGSITIVERSPDVETVTVIEENVPVPPRRAPRARRR